ncbi:MAG: FAD-binding protein [Gemmatimonadaceae bacterium]
MHAESSNDLAEQLRTATDSFRITANGSWLSAGRPVAAQRELSVRGIRGIVEYVPGDLTITVRAGTSHSEIDAATFGEGQWLGLDPAGADLGTIGATVATASVGPLVHGIGAVRDIVLGVEVVAGNGVVTRSGGKVVKNVAGFDLVRLQTGAWGTLGVITEMSLRLRARPETDVTVALELDARTPMLAHLVRLRNLTLAPLALELIGAPLAQALGISQQTVFLVRLGGNESRVNGQRALLATLGSLVSCDTSVWENLRRFEATLNAATNDSDKKQVGTATAVARVSHLPSQLHDAWAHVHAELASHSLSPAFIRATTSRGVIRVLAPQPATLSAVEYQSALTSITRTLAPPGGHVVWEQLPASAWSGVPSLVFDELSRGLQRTFDPDSRCNFGILGASFVK